MTTPTGIPEISQAATAYLTHNKALRTLDTRGSTVTDNTLTAPPVSPGATDVYIPAATATGDWAGQENNLARFEDGFWVFYAPYDGQFIYSTQDVSFIEYNGTSWNTVSLGSDTYQVQISSNDTTPAFLDTKLVAGTNITLTENNDGGNETLTIDATGGGSALEVEDEGISLSTAVTKLNFVGAGVTATEPITDEITVTIPGGGSGIETQDEGVQVDAAATTLNFVGAGVTATDAGSNVTTVTIPGGGSAIEVEDEGVSLTTGVTKFNFVGAGVTATEPITDEITVTIPGGGSGITTQDEGVQVDAAATTLNFVGAGVTATDAGSNVTTITIPGGGGAASSLVYDTFTDTNGTLITAHTPDVNDPGNSYTEGGIYGTAVSPGSFTINASNQAISSNTNQGFFIDTGSDDVVISTSVDFTQSGTHTAYILLRYVDENNFVVAFLSQNLSGILGIEEYVGGASNYFTRVAYSAATSNHSFSASIVGNTVTVTCTREFAGTHSENETLTHTLQDNTFNTGTVHGFAMGGSTDVRFNHASIATLGGGGGGGSSPLTTKGDIYTYDTADARLPVGADGQVLVANSATSTGLEWQAPTGGGFAVNAETLAATKTLVNGDDIVQALNPNGTARDVVLPDPGTQDDHFVIINNSDGLSASGNTLNIKETAAGSVIQTLDDTTGKMNVNCIYDGTVGWILWS